MAGQLLPFMQVSTHSRLKAAVVKAVKYEKNIAVSTHSRLKAAGAGCHVRLCTILFQHTAA